MFLIYCHQMSPAELKISALNRAEHMVGTLALFAWFHVNMNTCVGDSGCSVKWNT